MVLKWFASLGVGICVAAGAACATHQVALMGQDVDTPIILFPSASACTLVAKLPEVTTYPDKWLTFEIASYCGSQQVVVVGNFRTEENPGEAPKADCSDAMHGGAPSIFQQDDLRRRTATIPSASPDDPEDATIRLKLKKNAELPGTGSLTYYFDVCLNGAKADPRLIIER